MAADSPYRMDVLHEPDARAPWRRVLWAALAAAVVAAGVAADRLWLRAGAAAELEDFLVAEVERGDLPIEVQGVGALEPVSERWITTEAAGVVEEVLALPGSAVAAGDPLIRLANPQLRRSLNRARLEIAEAEADHRRRRAAATERRLGAEEQVLAAQASFEENRLRLEAQTELLEKKAVSELDYRTSQIRTEQARSKLEFQRRRFAELRASLDAEKAADEARLAARREALRETERQIAGLLVASDIAGTVRDLMAEPGQRLAAGAQVARVAETTRLMAAVRVPESYANHLAPGQPAAVSALGAEIPGVVARVDPAVTQGGVAVDVELTGPLPAGARPDLSIRAAITVARLEDALFVRRPADARDMGAASLFVLDADRRRARRAAVRFGLGTLRHIAVADGLQEGDAVLLGDTSRFDNEETVALQ